MDNSFQAAMNDLVAADAARMSGRAFADARGAGLARRVRTRRRVRAAGMGGASTVAVGAIALGASHLPGRDATTPGIWPAGCKPTAVANIGAIWTVPAVPRAHVIDVSEGKADGAWYLYDDNLEMVVLQLVPTTFGIEVTFADGTRELVQGSAQPLEPIVFAAPGGGFVTVDLKDAARHVTWTAIAAGSLSPYRALSDVEPPFAFQWTGCGFGSSSAAPDPGLAANPIPSVDPSLAVSTETATSPFQCGSMLPTESYGNGELWIDGTKWMDGAAAAATIREGFSDPAQAPAIGSLPEAVPVVTVHFAGTITDSGLAVAFGTAEPSVDRLPTDPMDSATDSVASEGATYVGVVDGRVVATGTVPVDGSTNAPPVYTNWGGFPEDGARVYLLDESAALTSCDANPVDSTRMDLFAVAGLIVRHPDGTVVGPTYAWLRVGKQ
jgi:hypothetical protein